MRALPSRDRLSRSGATLARRVKTQPPLGHRVLVNYPWRSRVVVLAPACQSADISSCSGYAAGGADVADLAPFNVARQNANVISACNAGPEATGWL